MRALIIDDEPRCIRLISRALFGWKVSSSTTLAGGIQMAKKLRPSVIILDVNFHGNDLTGLDYIPRLAEASPGSRIILVTSDYCDEDAHLALENKSVISYAAKGDVALLASLALAAYRAARHADDAA